MHKGFSFVIIVVLALVIETVCFSQDPPRVTVTSFSMDDGLTNPWITSLFQDSRGYLWIGTEDGLNRYDGYTFKKYRHRPGDTTTIMDNRILKITEDAHGYVLIITNKGVSRKNKTSDTFTELYATAKEKGGPLTDIFTGASGYDWRADSSSLKRILLSLGKSGKKVTAGFVERGKIWMAIDGSIYFLIPTQKYPRKYFSFTEKLRGATVTALWKDRTGNLWAGTTSGLKKITEKPGWFTIWPVDLPEASGVKIRISSVLAQGDRIWAGTLHHGILWIDRKSGQVIRHFSLKAAAVDNRINRNTIYCFFKDRHGVIWTGTDKGMEVFDPQSGRFVLAGDYFRIRLPDTLPVFTIDTTFAGDIWMGSDGTVFRLDNKLQKLRKYVLPEKTGISGQDHSIYTIYQSSDTRIWVGGVKLFGRIEPEFNEIVPLDVFSGEISNDSVTIFQLLGNSLDSLWAVTNNGLAVIRLEPYSFYWVAGKGASSWNASFFTGLIDKKGVIWLGSKDNVIRYNTNIMEFLPVNMGDDKVLHFNPGARQLSSGGEMIMGGDDFILDFYPDSIRENLTYPTVIIESIRYLSGKGWNDVAVSNNFKVNSENLNLLELRIKALDFTNPGKNRIMYRIKGGDNQWHIISGNEKLFITNLKNRTYRVYVRTSGPDGEWSDPKWLLTFHTRNLYRFLYLVFILVFLMIMGLLFAYVDYRTRSLVETNRILKEKERIALEVKRQRDQLSYMHKNLTDSIRYAQKIQQALLPSEYYFHRLLPESFILYMPRDIVSGDFYWINKKNDKVFLTVADCTGHGVPGAFMSMIGFEILDKIINDQGIIHPDEILNILNHGIINTFSRGEEDLLLKDGMDISFCTIDRKKMMLEFSGAFHVLYLIRENSLLEYRGNRVSIGLGEEDLEGPYTRHVIDLQKGDRIYLFTDGFPDQFGGPQRKKFMYRRFRHLLLSIHQLPMQHQRKILQEQFIEWKGDDFQVDDVLIVGLDPLA